MRNIRERIYYSHSTASTNRAATFQGWMCQQLQRCGTQAGGDGARGKGAGGKAEDAGHRNDFGYLYKPLKKGNSLQ